LQQILTKKNLQRRLVALIVCSLTQISLSIFIKRSIVAQIN
jgi:hypothetical protein